MHKSVQLIIFMIIFIVLVVFPFPWNDTIDELTLDLLFKIRGDRSLSDKIAVVYIGDEDIQALGGWPISRDYYSYAIHILSESGARVIGLDIYFSKAETNFPEFDTILNDFLRSAGNVCLPLYFSELKEDPHNPSGFMRAENPRLPLNKFSQAAAGIGFSNLGIQTKIRDVPLLVSSGDSILASFGCELFRLYTSKTAFIRHADMYLILADSMETRNEIKLKKNYKLILNHFGSAENVNKISFIRLITEYAQNPGQFDFKDKLVVIMNAASGITPVIQTPLDRMVPASLMHITAAENLVENNYIRGLPLYLHCILIALMLSAAFFCLRQQKIFKLTALIFICIFLFMSLSVIFFGQYNLLFPVFYPTSAFLAMLIFGIIYRVKASRNEGIIMRSLLEEQVQFKETELQRVKNLLSEQQQEIKIKSDITEQTKQLITEQKSEILRLQNEINDLKAYMIPTKEKESSVFEEIICAPDGKIKEILNTLDKISTDDITVLITGETGTGKELIARAIHNLSKRRTQPFVAVNCGALSETLLGSELFGHEKGSFTGALNRRIGRFEKAQGGTVFLDEVGETSGAFQVKLLRILQESTFERVGGQESIRLNIRVIAATNKNLQQAMESGQFRSDLYYRLNGFPIHLPPLRERAGDIPLLAAHFLKKLKSDEDFNFSTKAITALQAYNWPGNVRELENVVHRAALLARGAGRHIIQEEDLTLAESESSATFNLQAMHKPLEMQILNMLRTLRFEHASISKTARALGNRDRGTVTEHFRGICFQEYVLCNYDKDKTVQKIADTTDEQIIERVEAKLDAYLDNLSQLITEINDPGKKQQAYQGLPKKYHSYLDRLISHLRENKKND